MFDLCAIKRMAEESQGRALQMLTDLSLRHCIYARGLSSGIVGDVIGVVDERFSELRSASSKLLVLLLRDEILV